jgi:UDP-3-O-[3-hydroxymyristoyl] N-acetylglucosamine deacetylase/3-hydroxyacyl-[acyl-carrier-protein] dehydratase
MEQPFNSKEIHFQHTIKDPVTISGAGIHTGQSVTINIKPAEPGTKQTGQELER